MHERDQLDVLIDSAAAKYAEPPIGLEDRVLMALAKTPLAFPEISNRRACQLRRILPWGVASAAAACVLIALFVLSYGTRRETQAHNNSLPQPRPAASPTGEIGSRETHITLVHLPTTEDPQTTPPIHLAARPKLDVFPAPQPLTSQEQALVVYTARASAPQLRALVNAEQHSEAPLSISALQIQPLELPDQGNK